MWHREPFPEDDYEWTKSDRDERKQDIEIRTIPFIRDHSDVSIHFVVLLLHPVQWFETLFHVVTRRERVKVFMQNLHDDHHLPQNIDRIFWEWVTWFDRWRYHRNILSRISRLSFAQHKGYERSKREEILFFPLSKWIGFYHGKVNVTFNRMYK